MKNFVVSVLTTALISPVVHAQDLNDIIPGVVPQIQAESRSWRAPIYKNQSNTLGYSSKAFSTPKGMEKQVQFWVDVYSKYTSEQGIIHDSENVEKIYRVVDLKGLKSERERQRRIDLVKEEIGDKLKLNKEQRGNLRFQLGQKDRMQKAIFYSGRYIEDMEKIFRSNKLPVELVRLVYVESSFNVNARSKVGASGMWQIMPYTARPYNMISKSVDKRNHPLEATRFAARLLRSNYNMLESWPLAVTGYNHGPTGVAKMVKRYKSRDLSYLVDNVSSRKSFGFASRNFYASFLAALEVERNANDYFGVVLWSKPLDSRELKLPKPIKYRDLVKWFDGDHQRTLAFNPHLTYSVIKKGITIPSRTIVSVPKDKYNVALVSLAHKNGREIASEKIN
ncbi:lytic transglycosylase domain-containing protein [Bdellovibrio sp. SKB1291214]|uniref:lytic transglycosylase domain-containing protein n=1 Tax=Bdellovibrio sp. SKB1291214 TaxID=1732569 RepID=UPI00223FF121|nr:lytic transglycosylase domain-containing protein [Bdellovibrio sp. SKB1291214]UYL09994.1 lytic transglycosylase domain-containing protein [Bdellovibrio sp. SKB1291214]